MNDDDKSYSVINQPETQRKKSAAKRAALVFCALAAVVGAVYIGTSIYANTNKTAAGAEKNAPAIVENGGGDVIKLSSEIELSEQRYNVVDVANSVSPSVVSINVTSVNGGAGSGIIVNEDTENIYIATNYHVVENAKGIKISMGDDNEATANLIGSNEQSDLAVISVAKTELANAGISGYTVAKLGDSNQLEVGEYVVAIGNALGEGNTVTDGIVSAKNKEINIGNIKLSVLQTNAAINQGNSGGPLSNMSGEIVGINTAKLSKTGVEGMGYSIPINDAKLVIDDILNNRGEMIDDSDNSDKGGSAPQLGVQGITVTVEMMNQYGFPSTGVYVAGTVGNSGAEAAGLKRGDIIAGFESAKIATVEELAAEIQKCESGDSVKIYVYRDGATTPERINAKI